MSAAGSDTLAAELEALSTDGLVVLPRLLAAGEIGTVKAALAPWLDGTLMGRNRFEGLRSQRVYALLAKAPVLADLVAHPRVLRLLDHLLEPNYLLSGALAIQLESGETFQQTHFDDGFYRWIPRPRGAVSVSTMWAIDDFTADNGATEVIRGSHRWADERPAADDPRLEPVVMPAGSVLVFQGTLWHRGGSNRSAAPRLGISPQYCQPWARQQENMVLAVPPEMVAKYPRRVQELLGYSLHAPFMGHVNGMHPARLIDPDYRERDRVDARRAAEMLERPRDTRLPGPR